ncbi:acyl carrier protein [Plantactinospora sp. B6F1]|uniref:phosphopantetheine-binding protein n=1 Tax=Plantactinospora sp. B6F1 TaxID=3158971 RepID=UPI00102C2AE5
MPDHHRLRMVFAQTLDIDPDFDVGEVGLYQIPGWDSMGHMSLMVAIEEEFGVEFSADHTIELNNFETAVRILRELGCPE